MKQEAWVTLILNLTYDFCVVRRLQARKDIGSSFVPEALRIPYRDGSYEVTFTLVDSEAVLLPGGGLILESSFKASLSNELAYEAILEDLKAEGWGLDETSFRRSKGEERHLAIVQANSMPDDLGQRQKHTFMKTFMWETAPRCLYLGEEETGFREDLILTSKEGDIVDLYKMDWHGIESPVEAFKECGWEYLPSGLKLGDL